MPRKNPVLVKLMERRTVVQSELSKLTVELEWLNSVLTPPKAPVATPEAVTPPTTNPAPNAANPGADL